MKATETKLEGCFVLEPMIFEDKRGYFFESFNEEKFNTLINNKVAFVQDNESFSAKGVLRGLHYQVGEHAQAKLVRVVKGKVLDVAVDIRKNSITFGQYVAVKCDNFYNKASEGGITYNDPKLNIDWQLPEKELLVSEKDVVLPTLENARL